METQWKIFEDWLKVKRPDLLDDLNPPASDASIEMLEKTLDVNLPSDFVRCLKIHDGQKGDSEGLFSGLEFLSSGRILEEWKIWKELLDNGDFDSSRTKPDLGVRSVWWSRGWIPFTYNGAGDHLCLDLDPVKDGQMGQIITLWHDDGARNKKASSFLEWFTIFVKKYMSHS